MDRKAIRILELEEWLTKEYVIRIESIRRCRFLGLTPMESEYELQNEAYEKEREYRQLKKLPPLPEKQDLIKI